MLNYQKSAGNFRFVRRHNNTSTPILAYFQLPKTVYFPLLKGTRIDQQPRLLTDVPPPGSATWVSKKLFRVLHACHPYTNTHKETEPSPPPTTHPTHQQHSPSVRMLPGSTWTFVCILNRHDPNSGVSVRGDPIYNECIAPS